MPTPALPVEVYRQRLKDTVALPRLKNIPDDPGTPLDEHRTFCNIFLREVVRWFGFDAWKKPDQDGERAADIRNWMSAHPERWAALVVPTGHTDFRMARDKASLGHLVVAAQVADRPANAVPGKWAASGHVAIVAPETELYASGSFNTRVPLLANVGSKENLYGVPLSKCFKPDPVVGIWLYMGQV